MISLGLWPLKHHYDRVPDGSSTLTFVSLAVVIVRWQEHSLTY